MENESQESEMFGDVFVCSFFPGKQSEGQSAKTWLGFW